MTIAKIDVKKPPRSKVSALQRQTKHQGLSADDRVLQLIEDGVEMNSEALALDTPWEVMTEPLRKALGSLADDELDALVKEARRSGRKQK